MANILFLLLIVAALFLILCIYILGRDVLPFRKFKLIAKILKIFEIAIEVTSDDENIKK